MVDVFISYSRRDQAMVSVLAHAMEAEGYDVWWDAELPPHQSYGDVITAKIASAKAALVVWSADAVQSEWVRAEADMARNQRKLIQTSLENVMPPLPFNQIQYADLSGWRGEADHPGWRKVKASLAELCGRPQQGRDRSAPPPRPHPQPYPQAGGTASKWPLLAGGGIALLALLGAGAFVLWQRDSGAAEPQPTAAPAALASAPSAAPRNDDAASRFDLLATVSDPDGYSNLRDAPSLGGRVVGRIEVGKAFTTYRQEGEWWQVRLADGKTGYVARSRIRLAGEEVESRPEPAEARPAPARADMTFPDSSTRLLTQADVAGLGPATLRYARNEIYARRGRRFRDPDLQAYFGQFAWYRPVADEVELNAVEERNVALLQSAEARYR